MKEQVLEQLKKLANERKLSAHKSLAELKDARNNETKSTAGDKHETGRAMVQAEIHRAEERSALADSLLYDVGEIDITNKFNQIEKGAVVKVNGTIYFISVGLGKIEIPNAVVYCISLASPIGLAMMGKSLGDSFEFQGSTLTVEAIE